MKSFSGFLFSLILLFFAVPVTAQSPGYMGKKLMIGYGVHLSPALIGSKSETVFNFQQEAFLDYAISKKIAVGVSAKVYNAVSGNSRKTRIEIPDTYGLEGFKNPSGSIDIKAKNYMCYAKIYKRGYPAPWGKYMILGANVIHYTATYDPATMRIITGGYSRSDRNYHLYSYSGFGATEQSFVNVDVLFGMGNSRIFARRIVVDYGYNINVFALLATPLDLSDTNIALGSILRADDYVKVTSAARLRGVNRFNVFCRIGILLF